MRSTHHFSYKHADMCISCLLRSVHVCLFIIVPHVEIEDTTELVLDENRDGLAAEIRRNNNKGLYPKKTVLSIFFASNNKQPNNKYLFELRLQSLAYKWLSKCVGFMTKALRFE